MTPNPTPSNKLDGHSLAGTSEWRDRVENDYYATPPESTKKLLAVEKIIYPAWEPACGEGHISKLLIELDTYSTDLIYRGYGEQGDFFKIKREVNTIITNPPFSLFQEFAERGLKIAKRKLILFGKLQVQEGL